MAIEKERIESSLRGKRATLAAVIAVIACSNALFIAGDGFEYAMLELSIVNISFIAICAWVALDIRRDKMAARGIGSESRGMPTRAIATVVLAAAWAAYVIVTLTWGASWPAEALRLGVPGLSAGLLVMLIQRPERETMGRGPSGCGL